MNDSKQIRRKILWATDFTGNAQKALPFITAQIRNEGADIHLLYVIPDIAHQKPWYGKFSKKHAERLTRQELAAANKRLDQLCVKYLGGCARFTKHTAVGDPADEILKLVDQEKMDMVVMGNRKPEIPDNFESTLEKVTRQVNVPVTLIEN